MARNVSEITNRITDNLYYNNWRFAEAQKRYIKMGILSYITEAETTDKNKAEFANVFALRTPDGQYTTKLNEGLILTSVIENEINFNFNAEWSQTNFMQGLNAADLPGIGGFMKDTGYSFQSAGPFSTQIYKGSSPIKLDVEFTCFNDAVFATEHYGMDSNSLTTADLMSTELSRLMFPKRIMGRSEMAKVLKDITVEDIAVLGGGIITGAASSVARSVVSNITDSKMLGDMAATLATIVGVIGTDLLVESDAVTLRWLRNVGNDFLYVEINNYISGFFVCTSLNMTPSEEWIRVDNKATPKYIKYKMSLTSLQVPSKKNINNLSQYSQWKNKVDGQHSNINLKFGTFNDVGDAFQLEAMTNDQ